MANGRHSDGATREALRSGRRSLPAPPTAAAAALTTDTIGFLLVPQFTMVAFAAAVEALRLANRYARQPAYAWRLYSSDGRPVESSTGLKLQVDGSFDDVGPLPLVVVCGGADIHLIDHTAVIARLRRLSFYGCSIGAMCTGSYVLAKAGLLDGYRCTMHWHNVPPFREEFPNIAMTGELYEIDRNRFTCAGGTSSIDMMLQLISLKKGRALAARVADGLIHHRMREPHEAQRMDLRSRIGVANAKLLAAVAAMEEHLEDPLTMGELASCVDLSPRQLERLFGKYLKEKPSRYYMRLRLERARTLLANTTMPVLLVGVACGFVSASHFSKSYSELFHRTPSEERLGAPRRRRAGLEPLAEAADAADHPA